MELRQGIQELERRSGREISINEIVLSMEKMDEEKEQEQFKNNNTKNRGKDTLPSINELER